MTMWARIENGTVAEITDLDPVGRFHPSLEWAQFDGRTNVSTGWLYDGSQFAAPPEAPLSVPQSVSMRQARLAMLGAGILDDVETAIAAMEGNEGRAARIDWEYALDVRREWPLINALGSQLGLTGQQIDELFIAAAAVPQ